MQPWDDAERVSRARRTENAARPRVLYVGGSAKSGTTLLGALLGEIPTLFDAGELNLLWEKWRRPGERCGCGERLTECEFWAAVMAEVEEDGVEPARMARLAGRLDRTRRLLRTAGRRLRRRTAAEWAELGAGTARLYRSVYRRSGAEFVVDNSKLTTHLMLLSECSDAELRLLHLVRDGRAVAYSWERMRRLQSAGLDQGRGMRHHGSAVADLAIWQLQNLLLDRLARGCAYAATIRYEDLAASPGPTLAAGLRRLGIDASCRRGPEPHAVGAHGIGGNRRVRFAPGGTAVVIDEAWRGELGSLRGRLWTLLAAPGLWRYGYPLRARSER